MGSLRELTDYSKHVHLILSNSGKADIYIHDTLKETYHASKDSIYEVKSKSDFNNMLELSNIQPYLADKWIFEITYSKVKTQLKNAKGVLESTTSCFCILVSNYREFKEVKEFVKNCNELYLPIIRKDDTLFLLKDLEISDKIKQFVSTSYARDPESIFTLREEVLMGREINSQRDVVKLLGASSGSVTSFVMLLLAKPPTTERGFKMVYKKRIQMGVDLCNAYGTRSFRNFLSSTVYDMLQLKMLFMEGVVYDKVRDIPDCFDESKLSKYNFYLERITNEISYEQLLRLYCMLQEPENKTWYSISNMIEFLYKYYGGVESDGIACEL